MAAFEGLLCTDEDVAEVAQGDYPSLVAKSSVKSEGTDGVFSSVARWTLTSESEPFDLRGIVPGHVCYLKKNSAYLLDLLGVEGTVGAACVLKRLGQAPGEGRPPGSPAGNTLVQFSFPTVEPLIKLASYELRRHLRVKDDETLESTTDLRQATIYWVLKELYLQQYRDSSANSAFRTKSDAYQRLYDATLASLSRTYGLSATGHRPATGTFVDDPTWRVPTLGD